MHLSLLYAPISLCLLTFQPVNAQINTTFDNFINQKNQKFQSFIDRKQKEFDDFRRKQNEEFASFIESGSWEVYNKRQGEKRPKEKDVPPIEFDENTINEIDSRQLTVKLIPLEDQIVHSRPKPIAPIKENDEIRDYYSFVFYGTKMKVRWGDLSSFKLENCEDKVLADAYRELTSAKYNNLLSDCLALRDSYALCDWAYFKMLEALATTIFGKNTNEAVLMQGVLYQQSGYTMRFAKDTKANKLCLLVKVNGYVYDVMSIEIEGKIFYLFNDSQGQRLSVCNMAYKDEQDMQMYMEKIPRLEFNLSDIRAIKASSFNINTNSCVNKNLIDFMQEYPITYDGKNSLTRWANYANTPVSEEVLQFIYPQLKERLQNTNKLMAVNMLLNWVQTGFTYGFDSVVWGFDRPFFAEETLFYPYSDCEDRAILFSHLIRDLLELDVALIYYPGHLAAAVCINEDVKGDYIIVNDRKFTICDPTYIRARAGMTMPQYKDVKGQAILCRRN